MRLPRLTIQTFLLTVAGLAAWLGVIRACPAEAAFGFVCGAPLLVLALFDRGPLDSPDRERDALHRAYLWFAITGTAALLLYTLAGGWRNLPDLP